jgi:hypothetical protein
MKLFKHKLGKKSFHPNTIPDGWEYLICADTFVGKWRRIRKSN